MTMECAGRRQQGSALLAVLWLSAALAAIAFSVATTVRGETERTATYADSLRAYYLASGSIDRAILWILRGPGYRNADGSPRYYAPPMPFLQFHYPSGEVVVEVMPETSKLNVNLARPDDLIRLLAALGVEPGRAEEIAAAIVDWRSPAPQGLGPLDQYYLLQNPSFRARHASFEEIEELLLVKGVTPELFYGSYSEDQGRLIPRGGLRDCLSVWGTVGAFDANTAAPPLLLSLGFSPETVDQIVSARRITPFRTMGQVAAVAGAAPRLRIGGNTIYTLRATARLRLPDGRLSDLSRSVAATVKLLQPDQWNPPYHILRWYDDAWSQSAESPRNFVSPAEQGAGEQQ